MTPKAKADILLKIASAVEVIHSVYDLAHLDLRLPNIAIQIEDGDAKVKLIDFDRSKQAAEGVDLGGDYPDCIMYMTGPTSGTWTGAHQDWLQFAVLMMMALRPNR